MPDSIPTGTIARPSRALFAIALDAQEIDGELALAMALVSSEDPEEREQGESLVTSLLEAAGDTSEALVTKSDQILEIAQWMQARAAHLKETAKQRLAAAALEAKAAEALINRVATVLAFRHPGQRSFALPEHTLKGRATASVSIADLEELPDAFAGIEVKIKVAATSTDTDHEHFVQSVVDAVNAAGVLGEVTFDRKPAKALIAKAIKGASREEAASPPVPGAELKNHTSWRID